MKIRIHVFYSLILIVSSTVPLISFSLVWLLSQLVGKVKKKKKSQMLKFWYLAHQTLKNNNNNNNK